MSGIFLWFMKSFDFNKNKNLKELDLGFIDSLKISQCKKLEKLNLEGYQGKKSLSLRNQKKLKEIRIDFSDKKFKLEDYHFSNKKGMKIIDLAVKSTKVNFLEYPNLEEISIFLYGVSKKLFRFRKYEIFKGVRLH